MENFNKNLIVLCSAFSIIASIDSNCAYGMIDREETAQERYERNMNAKAARQTRHAAERAKFSAKFEALKANGNLTAEEQELKTLLTEWNEKFEALNQKRAAFQEFVTTRDTTKYVSVLAMERQNEELRAFERQIIAKFPTILQ